MSIKIHFHIRTNRPSKDGSVQIFMLLSLNRRQRLTISMNKLIPLKKEYRNLSKIKVTELLNEKKQGLFYWDETRERAIKGDFNWESINHFLDSEKTRAYDILLKFQLRNKHITIELFRNAFIKTEATDNFKEYFTNELEKRRSLISKETYKGYKSTISKVEKFKPNITLAGIDYRFLTSFENYMSMLVNEKGLGNVPHTVAKTMKRIRALIQIAMKNDDFSREAYPFKDYRIKHIDPVLTSRDYLEPDDLYKVEQLLSPEKISTLTIGEIKATKRFLFACYTGLRFADVNSLLRSKHVFGKWIFNPYTKENVYKHYIELRMAKTDQSVFIPLIERAMDILNEFNEDKIFETISNQKINKHLKSINNKAELNKKLSFHVARHSFATICFLYGIPMEVGQKLLGHKN